MAQNIVITGANRGIGLALAKRFTDRGDTVYGICRNSSNELESLNPVTVIDGINVTSTDTFSKLKTALAGVSIDILINNAGILSDEVLGQLDFDAIRRQFEVNCLGPLAITEALLGMLNEGSKVAMITSRMGSIEDNTSGGRYGYRISKTALNAATKSLAVDLQPKGIAVALLHPGYVQTDMVNNQGEVTAEFAARGLSERIDELNLGNTGSFWHANGQILPW